MVEVCKLEGCGRIIKSLGYCNRHYIKFKRHGDPLYEKVREVRICSVDGCKNKSDAQGMCPSHYNRNKRWGDPEGGGTFEGEPEKWLSEHLNYSGEDCLLWPYAKHDFGYGDIRWNGRNKRVHIVMCEHTHGNKPSPKHEVRHLCGSGHLGCVNPNHLTWGTRKDNCNDKVVHGTCNRGEQHHNVKFKESDIYDIRKMHKDGFSQSKIANRYGVKPSTIGQITSGRKWGWLK